MAEFSVRVERIAEPVVDHPNADRLSLVKNGGFTCIAAKTPEGAHRYKQGDLVVYVPEGAVVPEWLLRREGFWSEKDGKGVLAGSKGDRVKALKIRSIFSQGILIQTDGPIWDKMGFLAAVIYREDGTPHNAEEGEDVAEVLGVSKYEPPIPASMAGEVAYVPGAAVAFDFESIQRVPDLFEPGEDVEATEKRHGTFFQAGYVPGLNHSEMFFDGNLYCCSKGLGAKGLVMKNNEANDGNVYVKALRAMLANGFGERMKALSDRHGGAAVRVFAEIFGYGVQDLTYGLRDQRVEAFDLMIGDKFLNPDAAHDILIGGLGIEKVPVLYRGPYDLDVLITHRDGKDTLSGTHVREGIVIRACGEQRHPVHGRKIGKLVSPAYLLRKGNATEFA